MARTGRFGRLPRAAPDLSGAIAALLREAQNQYDSNMVDAWKNGGKVDGKGVNDEALLAHFRKRRDSLSKDDPLWAEWDNRVTQYTFSIEESKMSLKWDQKKVTESDMRAFYLKWAKTATKDSEFRRHLESQAAKWVTTAKAGGSGGRKGSNAAAHAAAQQAYYDRHVKTGHYVNDYLIQVAKQYGAMPVNGNGLEDLNPNSAGYTRFLDVYLDGKSNDPGVQQMLDSALLEIRKFDPTFNWDKANIDRELREAESGAAHLVKTSTSKTEANGWQDIKDAVVNGQNRIQDAPIAKRMFDEAEAFETRIAGCNGDPYCVQNAAKDLRARLGKEQEQLLSQGIADTNIEITAPLGATIRVLDAVIAGRAVDGSKSWWQDRTIFELMGGTGTGQPGDTLDGGSWLGNIAVGVTQQIDTVRQGGWISSEPIMDGNQPRRDSNGEIVWRVTVQSEGDQPPFGAVLIEGSGALEGGPEVVPFYSFPVPVEVMLTAPDGTPVPSGQGSPAMPDPTTGELVPVDPLLTSTKLWDELPGVIGPDGVGRTLYRSGTGEPGAPYLYHSVPPTIWSKPPGLDKDGKYVPGVELKPVRDPQTGATVYPVGTKMALDPEGKPTLVFDYTPFNDPKAERVKLSSGLGTWGTYQTASGANAASIIEDLYARDKTKPGGAGQQGTRDEAGQYVAQFTRAAALATAAINEDIAAGRVPDPAEVAAAEALKADAVQIHKTNAAHIQGVVGNTYNDYWNQISSNQKDPATLRREATLRAAGITAARYGQAEVDRRTALLGQLETYEAGFSGRPLPNGNLDPRRTNIGRALLGDPGPLPEGPGEGLRKNILDPRVGASSIKVPGGGPLPGTPKQPSVVDQILAAIATAGRSAVDPNIAAANAEPVWGAPALSTGDPMTETFYGANRPTSGVPDKRRTPSRSVVPRLGPSFTGPGRTGLRGPVPTWGAPALGPQSPTGPLLTPLAPPKPLTNREEAEPIEKPVDIPLPPPPIPVRDQRPGVGGGRTDVLRGGH